MVTHRSTQVLLIFLSMFLLMAPAAGPAVAAPAAWAQPGGGSGIIGPPLQVGCGDGICDAYMGEDASTCPQDCAPIVTPVRAGCGDGICDAYMGENASTCPQDCAAASVPVITPTASATPAPATEEASATPVGSLIETLPAPDDGLETLPGCDLAAYESRTQAWQKGYGGQASPGSFFPLRTDNREVYVCTVQPVGEICIPIYQGLVKASQENMDNIVLLDCSTNGSCRVHRGPARQVGESICFTVTQADNLSCSAGCALAPRQPDGLVLPLFGNVPTRLLVPTACLAALMALGVALGIVFVARRSRKPEQPAADTSQSPPGWDTIPRSDGSS